VRSELFEYLSLVANSARDGRKKSLEGKELVEIVEVALGFEPGLRKNTENVLKHLYPINKWGSFIASIDLDAVPEDQLHLVQTVLNAGMAHNAVRHFDGSATGKGLLARVIGRPRRPGTVFLVSDALFKALLQCRAQSDKPPIPLGSTDDASSKAVTTARTGQRSITDGRNGRSGNGASYESDDNEFGRQVREDLLKALSLSSDAFDGLEGISAFIAELKRHIEGRRNLGVLGVIRQESESKLNDAVRKLKEEYMGYDRALRLIDEARQEISQIAPALKLLREPILFDKLIREVETDGQETLASRLRRLRDNIMPQVGRLN
jgi:hypothetical protein